MKQNIWRCFCKHHNRWCRVLRMAIADPGTVSPLYRELIYQSLLTRSWNINIRIMFVTTILNRLHYQPKNSTPFPLLINSASTVSIWLPMRLVCTSNSLVILTAVEIICLVSPSNMLWKWTTVKSIQRRQDEQRAEMTTRSSTISRIPSLPERLQRVTCSHVAICVLVENKRWSQLFEYLNIFSVFTV